MTVSLGGMIAAMTLAPAGVANASLGSVPAQVSAYVSDGELVARLIDIYGKNASGTAGLPFGDTTTAGGITRVYEWTPDRLANQKTVHPVQLTNNWVVPISIGDKPVGVATIWINPQSVLPELAEFDPNVALATALPTVAASAALVRDNVTHAWFALADGTVTPLVAGSSGVTTPAPVASLKLSASASPPASTAGGPNTGLGLALGIVAVIVVILLLALLFSLRRRPSTDSELPVDSPAPGVEPDSSVAPVETPVRSRQARSAQSAPTSPVTKPATSKPKPRATGGPTASTKPRAQKPPAQKPPKPDIED